MKLSVVAMFVAFVSSMTAGFAFIPVLRKIKAGQPILKYVEEHKNKNGTPTMGGLFFIMPCAVVFASFGGLKSRIGAVAMTIGLAFMVVGLIDDFIKIKTKSNEGLKPYQKVLFQTGIALVSGTFCFQNGITEFYLPFSERTVNMGVFTLFFVALIFVATTNCVNLTDGLDGLAGSVSMFYLIIIAVMIYVQKEEIAERDVDSYSLFLLSLTCVGGLLAFLFFNFGGAKVFMGDTGSLSLGGFIAAISLFSGNGLFIPVIGITFVFSGVSVIIQVIHFKRTGKRVFLMAPFHHHLEKKGLSESKIAYIYSLITVLTGVLSVIFYI